MLFSSDSSMRTHSPAVVYFQAGLRSAGSATKPSFCLSWEHLSWNDYNKSFLVNGEKLLVKKLHKISLVVALGVFHSGDEKWIWVCCIVNGSVKGAISHFQKTNHKIGVLIFWITTKRLSLQLPGGGREGKEGRDFRAKPAINSERQMVFLFVPLISPVKVILVKLLPGTTYAIWMSLLRLFRYDCF